MRVSGLRASGLADLPKPPQQGNRGRAARGGLGAWFWGGWAAAPFFLCYGVLHGSASDSRWHECGHGTAFRTPWMNDVVYHIASFMIMREPTVWRWSHARHHTDTLIVGRDPEIVAMRPPRLARILANFFGLVDVPVAFHRLFLHAGGRLTAEEKTFIPDAEQPKVFLIARIWLAIYGATAALCFAMGSILPAMLVGLPRLYGAWHHVLTGLTQHAGLAEDALDHRLNSRTVYMKPISRFVYWNMNYHVEHHSSQWCCGAPDPQNILRYRYIVKIRAPYSVSEDGASREHKRSCRPPRRRYDGRQSR